MGVKPAHKPIVHLMSIKQGADESLSNYARTFNEEALIVEDYTKQFAIHAMLNGLRLRGFKWDMARNTPKMLTMMIEEVQKHTMVESIVLLEENHEAKDPWMVKREGIDIGKKAKDISQPPWPPCKSTFDHYVPLNISRKDILN